MQNLDTLRKSIDKTDQEILKLLVKRFDLVKKMGEYKKEKGLKVKDSKREQQILENKVTQGEKLNLSPDFIKKIWKLLFNEAIKIQK